MAETGLPNTNYRLHPIKDYYEVPYPDRPMRVCVVSDRQQLDHGIKALDIAKRLIDYSYHPPIFFPADRQRGSDGRARGSQWRSESVVCNGSAPENRLACKALLPQLHGDP